uniref:Acyl-CoA reductase n=1 Tax=candidate division WOR-3 bacterium TaxID=2052148 RepID=A0A7V3ZXW6_UNCW3
MREDVLLLLDRYRLALSDFLERLKVGKIKSDVQYQQNLLVSLIEHYILCLDFYKRLEDFPSGPEKVFVFLPGNVPVIPFQLLPFLLISGVKEVFFKYPRREGSFYASLFQVLNSYLGDSLKMEGGYLEHTIAFERAKNYCFVIGFGGESLQKVFEAYEIPSKFFGSKFSIGILQGKADKEVLERVAWDNLAFDTKGCLSLRVLFSFDRHMRNELWQAVEKVSKILPPESDFRFDESEYEVYKNFQFFEEIKKGSNYFIVFSKNFVELSAPRTLQIVEVSSIGEIEEFISRYNLYLQGIASDGPILFQSNASIITDFGKLQFTPCNWYFEKGVNYKNFWEV